MYKTFEEAEKAIGKCAQCGESRQEVAYEKEYDEYFLIICKVYFSVQGTYIQHTPPRDREALNMK